MKIWRKAVETQQRENQQVKMEAIKGERYKIDKQDGLCLLRGDSVEVMKPTEKLRNKII